MATELNIFDGIDARTLQAANAAVDGLAPGDTLVVNIASYGGEVFMALAIIDLFRARALRVECNVLGIAASAAALIAISGDRVTMTPNSSLMLHSAWQESGEIDDGIRRSNSVQLSLIQRRCPQLGAEIFKKDNWYSAEDCLRLGLCDNITGAAGYSALVEKYCATLAVATGGSNMTIKAEELDTKDLVDQKDEEQPEAEIVEQDEPVIEEPAEEIVEAPAESGSVVDVLERLAQRIDELEQRIAQLTPAPVEPAEEVAELPDDEQERIDAILQSLCKPRACVAVGATPRATAVYKPNKDLMLSLGD